MYHRPHFYVLMLNIYVNHEMRPLPVKPLIIQINKYKCIPFRFCHTIDVTKIISESPD